MKKLVIVAVVLTLGMGVAVALGLTGSKVEALGCIRCMSGGTTAPAWGMGSTCAAATNDAIANASALIPSSCLTCQETVISVDPCGTSCSNVATCYTPYGQWRVDVKISYKCEVDFCQ